MTHFKHRTRENAGAALDGHPFPSRSFAESKHVHLYRVYWFLHETPAILIVLRGYGHTHIFLGELVHCPAAGQQHVVAGKGRREHCLVGVKI